MAITVNGQPPNNTVVRLDGVSQINQFFLQMQAYSPSLVAIERVSVVTNSVDADPTLAAWWPANGEAREVVRGNHDWEFLPRGASFGPGEVGQGFAFNGSDHYGRTAAHTDLNIGASAAGLTIELWAKPSRVQDVPLVMWTTPAGSDGASVRQWNGGLGLFAFLRDTAGNDHTIGVNGMFVVNTWTHVAVTYDRTTGFARLYRNGVLVLEQDIGIFAPQTGYPLVLGALPAEGRYYQGPLDEIGFYTRPLTMAEIQAIHQAGVSGKAPPDDNQPPVLHAGPDVAVLNPGAVVPLNGTGRPTGPDSPGWLRLVARLNRYERRWLLVSW